MEGGCADKWYNATSVAKWVKVGRNADQFCAPFSTPFNVTGQNCWLFHPWREHFPPWTKWPNHLIRNLCRACRTICAAARACCRESDNARAILLAVGIVAFFALASLYSEYRSEHETSVPGCDSILCSDAFANLPSATSTPEDSHHRPRARLTIRITSLRPTPMRIASRTHRQEQPAGHRHVTQNGRACPCRRCSRGAVPGLYRRLGKQPRRPHSLHGRHASGTLLASGMHPCGKALDVCQLRRGVVDPRCHLPARRALAQIASSHGLFEGGRWCNSDYGHVQLGVTAGDCGDRRTRIVRRHMAPETRRESCGCFLRMIHARFSAQGAATRARTSARSFVDSAATQR